MDEEREKALLEEIDGTEELCKYCPWTRGGYHNTCMGMCEGRWCEEAGENYLEEMEEK